MIDHDGNAGAMLSLLDELGIAQNTIVLYSTDNGPHMNSWPDGEMTPFRSEKDTNWEGAFRVPLLLRWPGLLRGHEAAGKKFKVHIDGYNLVPFLAGKEKKCPREGFIYFDDDGDLVALRYDNWKMVFREQRTQGTLDVWAEPLVTLRIPKLFNLRTDPFERADVTSNTYWDWYIRKAYLIMAAQGLVERFLQTFRDYPPRQRAASFTIDQAMEKMETAIGGAGR